MTAPDAGYTPDPADERTINRKLRQTFHNPPWAGHGSVAADCHTCHTAARAVLSALAATGRLLPPGSRKLSDEWAVSVTREAGDTTIRHEGDPYVNRGRVEQIADYARNHPTVAAAEPVTREAWVTPWLPAPTNTEENA